MLDARDRAVKHIEGSIDFMIGDIRKCSLFEIVQKEIQFLFGFMKSISKDEQLCFSVEYSENDGFSALG